MNCKIECWILIVGSSPVLVQKSTSTHEQWINRSLIASSNICIKLFIYLNRVNPLFPCANTGMANAIFFALYIISTAVFIYLKCQKCGKYNLIAYFNKCNLFSPYGLRYNADTHDIYRCHNLYEWMIKLRQTCNRRIEINKEGSSFLIDVHSNESHYSLYFEKQEEKKSSFAWCISSALATS